MLLRSSTIAPASTRTNSTADTLRAAGSTRSAKPSAKRRTSRPIRTGSATIRNTPNAVLVTEMSFPVCSPMNWPYAKTTMIGMVMTLSRLVTAVSEIDQRDISARKGGQEVGGHAARRGGDDHQPECELRRHRPEAGKREGGRRQHDDLRQGADREVARAARHAREVLEGEAETEAEHDEGERERQDDIDHETH